MMGVCFNKIVNRKRRLFVQQSIDLIMTRFRTELSVNSELRESALGA